MVKIKAQIVVVVPSLDTAVCAAETRKFNEAAAKVENAEVIVVSMVYHLQWEDFVQLKESKFNCWF